MVDDVSPEVIEQVSKKTKLLFVDAWAPWCGPCTALTPILEELDEKYADNQDVKFLKINTENHRKFAMEKGIHAIPCVLIFFKGEPAKYEVDGPKGEEKKVLDRLIGLRPIEHYEDVIRFFSDK
jgi:thioredoxin 1